MSRAVSALGGGQAHPPHQHRGAPIKAPGISGWQSRSRGLCNSRGCMVPKWP